MADELRVTQAGVQVEHTKGNAAENDPSIKVTQAGIQVEQVGGGGMPLGVFITQGGVQVENNLTDKKILVTQLAMQVEYLEVYPNIPLSSYSARVIVDLFTGAGVRRCSTEDTWVEEL